MNEIQIRARAERERRRRSLVVIDTNGTAHQRGEELSVEEAEERLEEIPAGDRIRAIDFRVPGEDQL